MTKNIWEILCAVLSYLAIGCVFALLVLAANVEIKDLDLWLHLKMGELIVENGFVPSQDILSCTAVGKPWINHEWLFQVVLYLFYHFQGYEGLTQFQVIVVCLTLMILFFLGYQRQRRFTSVAMLLLVMLVYRLRFTIRPDIISLLFFSIYIYIMALCLDRKWALAGIFIVQVLWSNFHGFFFFGPLLILLGIVAELIKRRVPLPWEWNQTGRLSDQEFRRLKQMFGIAILASLFNPQFIKGAWYPISVLFQLAGESKIFFYHIQELKAPMSWQTAFDFGTLRFYKILILISSLSFVFNRRKIDIGDLLLWVLFLVFSLAALRNIVFFAFAAYLVCVTNFSNLSLEDVIPIKFTDRKFKIIIICFLEMLLILWMVRFAKSMGSRGYFDFDKMEMKSEFGGVTRRSYPEKAADFLVEHEITGNFFNDFNSGAYLIGRCYPNIRPFIDGRTELHGPEFFKKYNRIWTKGDTELFEDMAEKYHLTGAFLNSARSQIPDGILQYLYENEDWILVYFDYDAVIFLKDVQRNRAWINELRVDLKDYRAPDSQLEEIRSRRVVPFQFVNRAFTLEALGFDDAALAEADAAIKISPGYIEPYNIKGKIYGKNDNHQKAFENYRIAAMIATQDQKIRANLGLAYENLNQLEGAKAQYWTMIKQQPKKAEGHFLLARALARNQEYKEMEEALLQAADLDPDSLAQFERISEILFEKEEYKWAIRVAEMGLAQKESAGLYFIYAKSLTQASETAEAFETLEKALSLVDAQDPLKKDILELLEKIKDR